jgi:hypothetical protein
MEWLAGTELMQKIQSNRVIIVYNPNENQGTYDKFGLYDEVGPHFMRKIDDYTYEFMFAEPKDMKKFEEHLSQYKLSLD